MNYLHKLKILMGTLAIAMALFSATAYANDDYTVLAPLPGTYNNCTDANNQPAQCTNINQYLKGIFNLSISLGAVLAFVMITFGGIMYATSDSITGKTDGKNYVTNAVWGLILVIGAWIILNTINPEILKFNLNIDGPTNEDVSGTGPTGGVTGGTGGGTAMTPQQLSDDALIRSIFANVPNGGIQVNNGPCTQGQTKGCTNLNGLPPAAVQGLIKLKEDCGCAMTITGGTEGGHQTHGPGLPRVDIAPYNVGPYFRDRVPNPLVPTNVTLSDLRVVRAVYEPAGGNPNGTSTGDHWHLDFQ